MGITQQIIEKCKDLVSKPDYRHAYLLNIGERYRGISGYFSNYIPEEIIAAARLYPLRIIGFYDTTKKRTYDFFEAYYAQAISKVFNFCDKYEVDYFVVYKKHFSKEYLNNGRYYFNPFNEYIKEMFRNRAENEFAVLAAQLKNVVFEDEYYIVLRKREP